MPNELIISEMKIIVYLESHLREDTKKKQNKMIKRDKNIPKCAWKTKNEQWAAAGMANSDDTI